MDPAKIFPLSELPEKAEFTSSNFGPTHAPTAMLQSCWSTLHLLQSCSPLSYSPTSFSVISSNASKEEGAAFHVLSYLDELSRASFEVATSLLCSSVLAGRSSESDEYGDIGVWIGSLAQKDPEEALKNLGIYDWVISKKGKIIPVAPSTTPLPSSLSDTSGYLSSSSETPKIHVESLSKLLSNLESPIEFRVEGLGDGVVLYFYVGHLSEELGGFEANDGYAGLIGVGISGDYDDE